MCMSYVTLRKGKYKKKQVTLLPCTLLQPVFCVTFSWFPAVIEAIFHSKLHFFSQKCRSETGVPFFSSEEGSLQRMLHKSSWARLCPLLQEISPLIMPSVCHAQEVVVTSSNHPSSEVQIFHELQSIHSPSNSSVLRLNKDATPFQ